MNEVPSASASVAKLINTIHGIASSKQNSPVLVGLVIAPLPDIKIATSDIILDKNDLYINAFLLKNYSRSSRGKLKQTNERGNVEIPSGKGNIKTASAAKRGGVGKPSFVSHYHKINSGYKANLEGDFKSESTSDFEDVFLLSDFGLQVGDRVALLAVGNDAQKFIILQKIFNMTDLTEEMFADD